MAYGLNAPFGLRPIATINGGSWTEKTNVYNIYANPTTGDTTSGSIFTGDPVMFYFGHVAGNDFTDDGTIHPFWPHFNSAAPSTWNTDKILGVFQGCEYTDPKGMLVQSAYFKEGTRVQPGSKIKAYIIDDPNVVFEIQLSTNMNAVNNKFVARPVIPIRSGSVEELLNRTGGIGSNFALALGGGTNFDTITDINNQNRGFKNNPQAGDVRTGQSVFYICTSTSTALNNNFDYDKSVNTLAVKVIGYSDNVQNIAATGQTRSTTPFLNVKALINNHVYKAGTEGIAYRIVG